MASSLGKICTTSVRRSTSRTSRSIGLVEWIWLQWPFDNDIWSRMPYSASCITATWNNSKHTEVITLDVLTFIAALIGIAVIGRQSRLLALKFRLHE